MLATIEELRICREIECIACPGIASVWTARKYQSQCVSSLLSASAFSQPYTTTQRASLLHEHDKYVQTALGKSSHITFAILLNCCEVFQENFSSSGTVSRTIPGRVGTVRVHQACSSSIQVSLRSLSPEVRPPCTTRALRPLPSRNSALACPPRPLGRATPCHMTCDLSWEPGPVGHVQSLVLVVLRQPLLFLPLVRP